MLLLLCDKKNNPNITTKMLCRDCSELPCSIDPYRSSDNVLFKISENQFLNKSFLQHGFTFSATLVLGMVLHHCKR